ncbi:MAG TPA: hypothetical protein VK788_23650 [Terriglobales bacterium]|jgi:hypothetical protein|nr:hypothetical protein [Terriglobales bacterium]
MNSLKGDAKAFRPRFDSVGPAGRLFGNAIEGGVWIGTFSS